MQKFVRSCSGFFVDVVLASVAVVLEVVKGCGGISIAQEIGILIDLLECDFIIVHFL